MVGLKEHFKRDERDRHSSWLHQQKWFIKARQDKQFQQQMEDRHDDNVNSFAASVVLATEIEIANFETKLDGFDEATITALMENESALEAVNARIADLLDRAHTLDDGRRVFRTVKGDQVYDEFGKEVTASELDPDAISPDKPTWEEYKPELEARLALEKERQDILDFQKRVDAAREEVSNGDITEDRLEELDADLSDVLPQAVARQMPGYEPPAAAPSLKQEFSIPPRPAAEISNLKLTPQAPQLIQ